MSSSKKREIITSVTTFTFIIIAITGIMMFFHVLDQYTKQLHEILGLAFVFIAACHIFINWKSMKNYFKKSAFLYSALLGLIVSISFIAQATTGTGKESSKMVMKAVFNAPFETVISMLGQDLQLANQKLKESGIKIENSHTISELSKNNNTSTFNIVKIISQ